MLTAGRRGSQLGGRPYESWHFHYFNDQLNWQFLAVFRNEYHLIVLSNTWDTELRHDELLDAE